MNRSFETKLVVILISLGCTGGRLHADLIGPGDIAFIGFNADGDDDFAFVTLADIAPATTVYFTDNEWNGLAIGSGGAFATNETTITWLSPNFSITAGTVVQFNDTDSSSSITSNITGDTISGRVALNVADESLWAYLGNSATDPTAFLAVVANEADIVNLGGTGLADGSTAQIIDGDADVMAYTGPRFVNGPFSDFLVLIGNDANWVTEGGTGDQSNNGIAPDVPFDTTAFANPEPSSLLLGTIAFGVFGACGWLRRRGLSVAKVRSPESMASSTDWQGG